MAAPLTLPKFRQQLILAVLMVCALLIWIENTVPSTALETLADPVRGLRANPGQPQWATGSYTLASAILMFTNAHSVAAMWCSECCSSVWPPSPSFAFYLQGALGFSPMKAALANIPTALGALAGAPRPLQDQARVSKSRLYLLGSLDHVVWLESKETPVVENQ
ncbi:hypothetical protein ACFWIY_18260 [Streptomyces sioyaensis]|uniref:hypothetical protein n=1 Tax=Streptomyces sioyaensis TaxID=67364 RepID=UPI0036460E53